MELLIKKTCSHHNSFLLVLLIHLSQLHLLNLSKLQGHTFFLEIDHTTKITFHMCHFLCLYCFLCCCIGQLKLEFSFLYYLAFVVLSLILISFHHTPLRPPSFHFRPPWKHYWISKLVQAWCNLCFYDFDGFQNFRESHGNGILILRN